MSVKHPGRVYSVKSLESASGVGTCPPSNYELAEEEEPMRKTKKHLPRKWEGSPEAKGRERVKEGEGQGGISQCHQAAGGHDTSSVTFRPKDAYPDSKS